MDGIQLIRLLDVLPITAARNAPGVHPRSLIVTGAGFENVDQVLLNGVLSPEFVVASKTSLVVQVPDAMATETITDVAGRSATPSFSERSLIEFTIGSRIRKLTGTQRLVQNFVRLLLRTPGSNIFHPTAGGGLLQRVGGLVDSITAADIAVAITNTKPFILAERAQERNIPAEERLLSAEIAGMVPDPASASIYVTLILTSQAGVRSGATLLTA